MTGETIKSGLAVAVCATSRAMIRHVPGVAWKRFLWNSLLQKYVLWRTLDLQATATFGSRFAGRLPDVIHGMLYFFGTWEPTITEHYVKTLRPGDVVIDIGANVGAHALLASRLVGPTGRVHAIEASPSIAASLEHNVLLNDAANVVVHRAAVMDRPGQVRVYRNHAENLGGTTVVDAVAADRNATQEALVEGRPLGAIVPSEDLRRARLIKIDVEGAEWLVVQGMRDMLPVLRPDVEILVEVSPMALAAHGASLDDLLALFAQFGFSAFEIANGYGVDHYLRPPSATPMPLRSRSFDLADLLFRRPART